MAKQVGIADQIHVARSALYRWLFEHRVEIATVFATESKPRWEALAAAARADGVLDKYGKPPNRGAVRTGWLKIERNMNEKATNRLSEIRPSESVSGESAPASPVAITESPSPPAARRHSIAVARFKSTKE